MRLRAFGLVLLLVVGVNATADAKPSSAVARVTQKIDAIRQQMGEAKNRELKRDFWLTKDKALYYGEQHHDTAAGFVSTRRAAQIFKMSQKQFHVTELHDGGPGGRVRSTTTIESDLVGKAATHKVVTEKRFGWFTLAQRSTVSKDNGAMVVKAGMRTFGIGRLRIPIGRATDRDVARLEGAFRETTPNGFLAHPASAHASGEASKNIVLGLRSTRARDSLDSFANVVGGHSYYGWKTHGFTSLDPETKSPFSPVVRDAIAGVKRKGGRIKFDLTGLDFKRRGVTSTELQLVMGDRELNGRVDFYEHDGKAYRKLDGRDVALRFVTR